MNFSRQTKWDHRYLGLAVEIATWSKDPSTKVGAVLVNAHNDVVGTGFNGFAPGESDAPELYHDRTYKYANVIHAEVNAFRLANHHRKAGILPASAEGGTLYTSFPCCPDCAEVAIERKVARVVFPPLPTEGRTKEWVAEWTGRQIETMRKLNQAGIWVSIRNRGQT